MATWFCPKMAYTPKLQILSAIFKQIHIHWSKSFASEILASARNGKLSKMLISYNSTRNAGIAILRGWTSFNISTGSAAVLLERISSNVAPRYWRGRCNSSRSQRRGDYGWSCRAADLTIDSLRRLKASLCGTRVALSAHDYLETLKVNWVERVLFWCVL